MLTASSIKSIFSLIISYPIYISACLKSCISDKLLNKEDLF